MKTFQELYFEVLLRTLMGKNVGFLEKLELYDTHQLDCLLHPEKHPLILRTGPCDCGEKTTACVEVCPFHAIQPGGSDGIKIDGNLCVGCELCIQGCETERLAASKDVIPALQAIRHREGLAYALIAPAFLGQFSEQITPGKLRNALKAIGFDGMIEVALLADILTLKEALEFDANIKTENDFQLTSCCCPLWIAMIRRIYEELMPHVPPSVSPMIAAGRMVKRLHPQATTVFIGPCLAKKAEAKEKDIAGAVDFVLTFQEVQEIFNILNIDPAKMEDSDKDHSSQAGRLYAKANGVSAAVETTLKKLNSSPGISIRTQSASGVPACREMLDSLRSGKSSANFFEGMGCAGGCVGGPRAMINKEVGKANVEKYAMASPYGTPVDNPYVVELLHRLGFETIENLLERSEIFTRSF